MPITTHIMRTIGFRSNILFAIAAAVGVIAALGRPWYAPAVEGDKSAEMESLLSGIGRAFTEPGGRTGWESFTQADKLIAGLAIATVVLLVLAMIPALQLHVQALARWTGLATFGDVERHALTVVVELAVTDGEDLALLGLLLRGVGEHDAGSGRLLFLDRADDQAIAEGDEVLYSKYGGTEIKVDGEDLLVLRESDVLAKVQG